MVSYLDTREVSSKLGQIIKKADKTLILISAFMKISPDYQLLINDAVKRGVSVRIVYGKEKMDRKQFGWIQSPATSRSVSANPSTRNATSTRTRPS